MTIVFWSGENICVKNLLYYFVITIYGYLFRPEDLCVAFTGGKDCTALLALYVALITKKEERHDIKALCVVPAHTFPEVDEFIDSCVTR